MCRQVLFALMTLLCYLSMAMVNPAMASPASAQERATNIAAELLVEGTPAPGARTMLAVRFTPQSGWHGYWKNPGDAGQPFDYQGLPQQVQPAGAVRYPVPEKLLISGLMNHVFKGEHVLLLPVKIAADATPGATIRLSLLARWLACTDRICVPEEAVLTGNLTIGQAGATPANGSRFDAWRAKLPFVIAQAGRFERSNGLLRIAIPLPESLTVKEPWLFAETLDAISYSAPQSITRNGEWLIVEAKDAGNTAHLIDLRA